MRGDKGGVKTGKNTIYAVNVFYRHKLLIVRSKKY